tara:strand:+ start:1545 stop:2273 length:729 start_codon:yes stop_codon:yes gene_type:complete
MTTDHSTVNNTIAPLSNVMRFTELVERLVNRPPELPGFGVFAGKAGLGKTFSAIYAINKYRARYVECDYTWTQKAFCEALMVELGLLPPRTRLSTPIYRAVAEIGDNIADNPGRPLIIDEADFLVKRKMIEIVRAIYKHCAGAGASIILIGEENMPNALKMWERVDSRVLKSVKAEPISEDDVKVLAGMVCQNLKFDKQAVQRLTRSSGGSARRVVTRLHDIKEAAGVNGWETITADQMETL